MRRRFLIKEDLEKVYKDVMPNGVVAAKRISQNSKKGIREFIAEILTIGRLQHPNLFRVLGYCQGRCELLLAYEYMPNASLDKFPCNKQGTFLVRIEDIKSLKNVASALTFLHESWVIVIIHKYIKASSVLINGELNEKLSDFLMGYLPK